jgi:RHS repeat-associated protein
LISPAINANQLRRCTTTEYQYSYDSRGSLWQVIRDGALTATYTYDSNGNRLSAPGTSTVPIYDDQDRLLSYSNWNYSYTANGELETKTDTASSAPATRYAYDGMGALRRVDLPDGRVIEYVIDGVGRRVGKKVNGTLVQAWLYAGRLEIAAELSGSGIVVSRFVGPYFTKGGSTYRLIRDQVGSVRLVVNVANGAVAQRVDYDEYGRVLLDTAPGFQPLGFAGGLYDSDTGLVRFGIRDYDPEIGRWTAKDVIGFAGRQANLYAYINNDPVNYVDVSGKLGFGIELNGSVEFGIGGGLGVTGGGGGGMFFDGVSIPSIGGFASMGSLGLPNGDGFPGGDNGSVAGVAGASAGGGAGVFVTNAPCAEALSGPFNTWSLNTLVGSVQLGWANGTWIASGILGPSEGASVSAYPTTTTATTIVSDTSSGTFLYGVGQAFQNWVASSF